MPQLDPSSYVSQVFWLLVSFFLMLGMMKFIVIPRIAVAIEKRKRSIESYVKKAEKLQEEALLSLEKYNKLTEEAKKIAENQTADAQEKIKRFVEEKSAETSKNLADKISENERIIAEERKETLEEIANISKDAAFIIVQKLGLSDVKKNDVEQAMQELRSNNND